MASLADLSAYQNYPLHPPPSGQISNFENPESRGPAIVIICSVFIGIMWPIFILRLYSKVWIIRRFGWDDASAIFAAASATIFAAGVIWSVNDKVLRPHECDVRGVLLTPHTRKISFILSPFYSLTMLFAKMALFLLYYRLFALDRWTKIATYSGMGITSCFYLATFIVQLVLCIPRPRESWTSMTCVERCSRRHRLRDVHGVFGLVSDVYIFILPLPVIYRLQMSLKKKIGVTAMFLTGLIAVVSSSIGLYYRVPESNGTDFTWNKPPAAGLDVVEAAVGVIWGSVPYLPAYFCRHSAIFSPMTHVLKRIRSGYRSRLKKKYVKQPLDVGDLGSKEPTPRTLQVETEVLGSIQGEGRFLDSGMTSRIWGPRSATHQSRRETNDIQTGSTRHEYYEMTELSQEENQLENIPRSVIAGEFSRLPALNTESFAEATETTATESSSRRGYWDMMSVFRSTNMDSTSQSGTYPRS